jgi:ribosomal protein S18 acetylase RimI-like enzyme
MPKLTDRRQIRAILETDRPWAVYALADLEPGLFEHAHWYCPANDELALGLFYAGFATPVLITVGKADALRSILDEIVAELNPPELYAVVKPEVLPLLTEHYRVVEERKMQRMILDPERHQPTPMNGVIQLGMQDLGALQTLYADGDANGEAPDWFLPQMLEQETYYGIREGNVLVAVAGTHVTASSESVSGLGNIYTRRDRRGYGLSARVTGAVVAKLLSMKLATIVLNVRASNAAAIHVYDRIGFRNYCEYVEAPMIRRK